MNVTLLYFEGCPSWQVTDQHLRTLEAELGFTVERVEITTPEAAEASGFRGSPSVHVDGVDLFAEQESPVGLSCRIYQTTNGPAGSPTLESLRAVLSAL